MPMQMLPQMPPHMLPQMLPQMPPQMLPQMPPQMLPQMPPQMLPQMPPAAVLPQMPPMQMEKAFLHLMTSMFLRRRYHRHNQRRPRSPPEYHMGHCTHDCHVASASGHAWRSGQTLL
jgi:hypothetical protein